MKQTLHHDLLNVHEKPNLEIVQIDKIENRYI
jgi:hypothetical protein